ncbi:hypothetical protein Tco_0874239 [Tanacetum coccineum]|uniref:Uncharacterized protein n=1 Tax=Tanacetum coccineum TaxID=301880 RepID=A0ABQ5BLU0_9ASTR
MITCILPREDNGFNNDNSHGRRTTATRGGETNKKDGREGERSGDQAGSGRNGQGSGRGSQRAGQNGQESDHGSRGSSRENKANGGGGGVPYFAGKNKNQDDNVTNENNQGNVRTINNGRGGCSYKEFMACNPKDYDGNVRDDNKRSRTGRAFAITKNLVRKEYTYNAPKCTNCNYHHQPEIPFSLCTNYNRFGNLATDCRVRPSGMDHYKAACLRLNRAPRSGGNRPNKARVVEGGQGRGNNNVQVHGRAFMMGAGEARITPLFLQNSTELNWI